MMVSDLFQLSTRMFRSRATRTWLTILGISVGIGAVLFLVSLGYGLQNVILEKIVFNQAMLSLTVSPPTDAIAFDEATMTGFREIPKAVDVAPMAMFSGSVTVGGLNGTVEVRGADANYFDYSGITPLEGTLYGHGERDKIVVSEAVVKLLGIGKEADIIGKEVKIMLFVNVPVAVAAEGQNPAGEVMEELRSIELPDTFKIAGIVKDGQDGYIYMPLSQIKESVTFSRYAQAKIKAQNGDDLQIIKDEMLNRGYQVISLSETIEQANKIFSIIQIILGLFGAVALVVSAIGMFNTMTVTLLERTNEIGIMRSLGGSKKDMRNLFLTESVVIGFLGGVVGIVVGIVGGTVFNISVNGLAAKFGGAAVRLFVYPRWFLFIIIVISVVIGMFSGILPARRAGKMDPLDALRYK